MTDQIPLKAVRNGSDVTALGEFASGDTISIGYIRGAAPTEHTHAAISISDSTTAGRALLTAVDAAAQRTSLGLGDLATQNASAAILDPLRRTVENASGGLNTVLYNAGGDACYVRIVPVTTYDSLGTAYTTGMGTGTLEAFLVNGVQKPWIGIGIYPAANVSGRVVSQPLRDPWTTINYDEAVAACSDMGTNWRLMSTWDWAAITHECMVRGYQPTGNTNRGRAYGATHQTGRRVDGGLPGVSAGTMRTLTGSGPNEWNHDNSPSGIADLVGNVLEWQCGVKLENGVVSLAADNGTVTTEASWVNTGFSVPPSGQTVWSTLSNDGASNALKRALIVPTTGVTSPIGGRSVDETGERMLLRGGGTAQGVNAGLALLYLVTDRSYRDALAGFRPVYVP
jgi:hypothetical protein